MVEALKAKFGQNSTLKEFLISTTNCVLVEASVTDNIWGIGMGENNPDVANAAKWKGKNMLGKALMEVRDQIERP